MGLIDSKILQDRARAERAARLSQIGDGINPDYVSIVDEQDPPDYVAGTGVPYGQKPLSNGLIQRLFWDTDNPGAGWQNLGSPVPSRAYVDDKASLLADQIDAFANGEGKTYTSLTGAMAVDPLPEDKTPFRVNGDTADDGNYIYDSSEQDGYKFLSDLVNQSEIQMILNTVGTEGEPFEVA